MVVRFGVCFKISSWKPEVYKIHVQSWLYDLGYVLKSAHENQKL